MKLFTLFYFVFLGIHSFLMLIDEFYFHQKRGLPQWERIGHPIDTFSVLLCFFIVFFFPMTNITLIIYAILFTISCLIIIKDEAIHLKYCNKYEQYLHAAVFVFHPIILINLFLSWSSFSFSPYLFFNTFSSLNLKYIVSFQFISIILFFLYQIFYWNIFITKNEVNNLIYKETGDKWYHSKGCFALLRNEAKVKNAWVLKTLSQNENSTPLKILDVACGGGFLSNELAKHHYNVTGIDLYDDALAVAKQHDETQKVNYLQSNAYALPFENESFDILCLMDFIEHIDDVPALLKESSRVLKKGGRIYFHTFNKNLISWFFAIKCVEWFIKGTPKNLHVYHLFIKPKKLISYFENLGFQKKVLVGIQPVLSIKSIFQLLKTREINEDFSFKISSSTSIGYLGYVEKL